MTKTFCDQCHKEIEPVNGVLSTFIFEIEDREQDRDGSIVAATQLKLEVCGECIGKIESALGVATSRQRTSFNPNL
jgi:hypothetical protein